METFHQAIRVDSSGFQSLTLDSEEEAEADIAREKLCLSEVAGKYVKIVRKWKPLAQLEFADPQLQEASKTFLYGFYRATILLCWSAVETGLKRRFQADSVHGLIILARDEKVLDSCLAASARALYDTRNNVAHVNKEPTPEEADRCFVEARRIVESLEFAE